MKRKIICYFENEAQCEAAVSALYNAKIESDAVRIISDNTKRNDPIPEKEMTLIGSSASAALPTDLPEYENSTQTLYTQAPFATLLIRGDLFTFTDTENTPLGSYAVEVSGDKDTLELAKDILLNIF